jgi:hypothetical protein
MRRALLVGVDDYSASAVAGSLTGCVADAVALEAVLAKNADGSRNWDTTVVTSDAGPKAITRDVLRGRLAGLFASAHGYDLLFFFAGHGGQTLWGADLVTQDASANSYGVSMNDLVVLANDSPARSVTILLDCCFSGDTGNTPGQQSAGVAEAFRLDRAVLRENVTILAASRATEPSMEADGHGAFTRLLLDGLEGGATDHRGNVTALSLYSYVSPAFDAWEQRPVLKTYLNEPVVLRVGPPWLDDDLLRRLPEHFPTADHRLQLTPAHEGEGRPLPTTEAGTPEQQEFDYVGRLRNANLATTDGRRDHYWVAMESGYVYLTGLGRYFWRLAARGRL